MTYRAQRAESVKIVLISTVLCKLDEENVTFVVIRESLEYCFIDNLPFNVYSPELFAP